MILFLQQQQSYQFNLSNNHSGFYRLVFSNSKWIDFVYDNEDVELKTDANSVLDSLKIIESNQIKFIMTLSSLIKTTKPNQNYFS